MIIHKTEHDNFNAMFLREYWQKKPCIIRQFSPDFVDPIDEHDLAGLAQEEGVDSRIVSRISKSNKPKWHVQQGPFEDFEAVCKGDWTLLVQGVDKYLDEVNALTTLVDFIPFWRLDDVMVSYSTAQAGVGAHTDEYDVFIIQGGGSRRWQVGLPAAHNEVLPHPLLKQIDGFEAIIDEVLMPGDAVYIPPKHPHNGIALGPCFNYSIGFRAPTDAEVLSGVLDHSENFSKQQTRYTDANIYNTRMPSKGPSEVTKSELAKLTASIVALLQTPAAEQALMQYLSSQQLPRFSEEAAVFSADVLFALLESDGHLTLLKMPGVRPIYVENLENTPEFSDTQASMFTFYIDGNKFNVVTSMQTRVISLLNNDNTDVVEALKGLDEDMQRAYLDLVSSLLTNAYWELEEAL